MKLRLLSAICALAIIAAAIVIWRQLDGTALWAGLGACTLAFGLLCAIYRSIARPIAAITTGVDLLRAGDFNSRLAGVGQRDADRIASTFNSMIDRLKEERLRVQEHNRFLDRLIKASPMGIVIFNFDGTVRTANPAACSMLECPVPEGRTLTAIGSPLALQAAALRRGDCHVVRLEGAGIFRISMLSFVELGFQREFLTLEALTDEVRRVEKAAYGKVIRQMAHEVNNTVSGVASVLDIVGSTAYDPELTDLIGVSRERMLNLSEFISSYAEMVKLPPPSLRPMELNTLVRNMLPFLESMASGRGISILTSLHPDPVPLEADPVQLEQAIVNIVKNAIESIGSNGSVVISTRADSLEITDNGPGISPEAAQSLFTPFFTTKPGGRGIGLMLVSEILTNHSFRFSLRTGPDSLTRFTIRLP